MSLQQIDAGMLSRMFLAGAKNLESKKEWINELNVFPVPDGDTGTNMTMTIMSAAREVLELGNAVDMQGLCKAILAQHIFRMGDDGGEEGLHIRTAVLHKRLEFIIMLNKTFNIKTEMDFKAYLESIGDSIVCVADDDVVKVHVHTNDPGPR